jgi:hypothetical protein
MRQNSSISIVADYRLDNWDLNPSWDRHLCLHYYMQTICAISFPEVKYKQSEADPPPLSCAKFMNMKRCTSAPSHLPEEILTHGDIVCFALSYQFLQNT